MTLIDSRLQEKDEVEYSPALNNARMQRFSDSSNIQKEQMGIDYINM